MKKFFKHASFFIVGSFWTILMLISAVLILSFCLIGLFSGIILPVNIVLDILNVWTAPWWLYVIETLVGSSFWIIFIYFIRNDYIEESEETDCLYCIEERNDE